jgi:hypothetical protein
MSSIIVTQSANNLLSTEGSPSVCLVVQRNSGNGRAGLQALSDNLGSEIPGGTGDYAGRAWLR